MGHYYWPNRFGEEMALQEGSVFKWWISARNMRVIHIYNVYIYTNTPTQYFLMSLKLRKILLLFACLQLSSSGSWHGETLNQSVCRGYENELIPTRKSLLDGQHDPEGLMCDENSEFSHFHLWMELIRSLEMQRWFIYGNWLTFIACIKMLKVV